MQGTGVDAQDNRKRRPAYGFTAEDEIFLILHKLKKESRLKHITFQVKVTKDHSVTIASQRD